MMRLGPPRQVQGSRKAGAAISVCGSGPGAWGRESASHLAFASAASVFPRFTYGFT